VASFTIGEVGRLLKLKPHIIRYWEKELPLIQPKKDLGGRMRYSDRDVQIFQRLKYLVYEKKFTLEGAKEEIYRELSGEGQDLKAQIAELRSDLLEIYRNLKKE
jgi:DNA-binding transcriptional MerR regulator